MKNNSFHEKTNNVSLNIKINFKDNVIA